MEQPVELQQEAQLKPSGFSSSSEQVAAGPAKNCFDVPGRIPAGIPNRNDRRRLAGRPKSPLLSATPGGWAYKGR